MNDVTGTTGPHPDLRQTISDALNRMQDSAPDLPEDMRLSSPVTPERLTVRCQRTWHDVPTWDPFLNSTSLSVCVFQFVDGGRVHGYAFEAVQRKGQPEWGCRTSSGGPRPPERADDVRMFHLAPGSHVTVGGLAMGANLGALRVEHADGSAYEVPVIDGCAIVFAPVTSQPSPDDHVVVRMLDWSGNELAVDTTPLGDGVHPRRKRQ